VEILAEILKDKGTQSLSQMSLNKKFLSRNSSIRLGSAISKIDGVSFVSTGACTKCKIQGGFSTSAGSKISHIPL
jgi:carbohydrate-selective porin OprB